MGLNDQVKTFRSGGESSSYFKQNVRYTRLGGDVPILFRIAPAFNPMEQNANISWMPFRYPNQELTDWGKFISVCPMVGRGGMGYGMKKDLISLKTFDPTAMCPLEMLYAYIRENAGEWGYLVTEAKDDPSARKIFGRPTDVFLCNILVLDHPEQGCQLGVISRGATKSLMSPDGGLVYQVAANAVGGTDHLAQWATGDLTNPNTGPVLRYYKVKENKGRMNTGRIEMHITNAGVMRKPLTQELMAQRIDLSKSADTYLVKTTAESLVADLVELLNGRSPVSGNHERVLLRQAFPQFRVPEPPAVSVNMGGTPAAQTAPAQGGFPAYVPPSASPAPAYTPPATNTGIPAYVPPTVVVAAPPVPVSTAVPAAPSVLEANAASGGGVLQQDIPAAAPTAPGDAIDTSRFDKTEWMKRLKSGQA